MDFFRAREWAHLVRREDLVMKDGPYMCRNCCICQDHFEDVMFMNAAEKKSLVNIFFVVQRYLVMSQWRIGFSFGLLSTHVHHKSETLTYQIKSRMS